MSHVTHSCFISHVLHQISWVMYWWVMSHTKESCPTLLSHVTHEWVMSHTNESCDTRVSHVTHEWVMSHMIKLCHLSRTHAAYANSTWVWVCVCMYVCVCVCVCVWGGWCVQSFSVDLCQHTARGVRGVSIERDDSKFVLLKRALHSTLRGQVCNCFLVPVKASWLSRASSYSVFPFYRPLL